VSAARQYLSIRDTISPVTTCLSPLVEMDLDGFPPSPTSQEAWRISFTKITCASTAHRRYFSNSKVPRSLKPARFVVRSLSAMSGWRRSRARVPEVRQVVRCCVRTRLAIPESHLSLHVVPLSAFLSSTAHCTQYNYTSNLISFLMSRCVVRIYLASSPIQYKCNTHAIAARQPL
jgi:hypothetical protein